MSRFHLFSVRLIFSDTNLLDWNSQNLLAVALSHSIYVWNAATKECQRVEIHFPGSEQIPENLYVSALSWSPYDQHLAVADSFGDITVGSLVIMWSRYMY